MVRRRWKESQDTPGSVLTRQLDGSGALRADEILELLRDGGADEAFRVWMSGQNYTVPIGYREVAVSCERALL